MSANEGDHAMMTALVQEEQRLTERLEKARKAFQVWRERAFKAKEAGRMDLYEEAEQMAMDARQAGLETRDKLEILQTDKDMLRKEVKRNSSGAGRAQRHAEHALGEFANLGVDPEEVMLKDLAKETAADDMLAAMKARMSSSEED